MSSKKHKTPAIRFKGFTDAWEQRKLMETNTSFTDGNYGESYPSGNDMSDSRNGVPFLRGSNLKNGKLDNSGANYITLEKHKELTSGHLVYDDIVIAVRGSLGALGYVDIDNVDWNINSQLAIIRTDKSELNGAFVIQFLSSNKGQKELLSRQTGTALKQLPIKQLQDVPVPKPELAEQNKISEFFRQLDDTIALHQRQLNNYNQLKKSMLQKMFPKDGEKVPEVRFDGFAEEWEQRKLGDVAVIKTGYPFNSEDFDGSGKYLVITNGNIQNDLAFVDNSLGNRIDVSDKVLLNNYELHIGDVLVTMDGTVGRTAKVICSNQIIAQRVGRLIAKDNSEFLYQSLNTGDFSKEMKKVSHGGTIKHISLTEISDYEMFVPATVEEQTKIGAFFKHLDDATAHHQQKVNGYQQLKNAMLQQMFV